MTLEEELLACPQACLVCGGRLEALLPRHQMHACPNCGARDYLTPPRRHYFREAANGNRPGVIPASGNGNRKVPYFERHRMRKVLRELLFVLERAREEKTEWYEWVLAHRARRLG